MSDKTLSMIRNAAIVVILLIAILVFGFDKNAQGHSGFQVIFHQGTGYILSMVLFFVFALVAIYFAFRAYQKAQQVNLGVILLALSAIIFLSIAFGKGCTDKANDGVTGPRGRPVAVK